MPRELRQARNELKRLHGSDSLRWLPLLLLIHPAADAQFSKSAPLGFRDERHDCW